jgi:hypothetical protein
MSRNGTDVPLEFGQIPPGRYVVEALENEAPA